MHLRIGYYIMRGFSMVVKIVYSATAELEITTLKSKLSDPALSAAASECLQSIGTILHHLRVNPYYIPPEFNPHRLWRDFSGYIGVYLEPSKHADGQNAHRMVYRVMSADNGFIGIDDPRFDYIRDRAGDLSCVDYVVHVWVGCYDYHGNQKSKTRSAIKDTFVG